MIKSLADWKRKLTVGTKWHCQHLGWGTLFKPKDMGVRKVKILQTNAVAFDKGEDRPSWLWFPPAKDLKFEGDTVTVYAEDGYPILVYTLVREG